ncbi:MAG: DUF2892 domain-containing protein [Saprospiraceae bacterium]
MKSNISNLDRIIRVLIAVVVAGLYFSNVISGTLAIVLGVVAVIFLATSLINFCPLYSVLGFSTRKSN